MILETLHLTTNTATGADIPAAIAAAAGVGSAVAALITVAFAVITAARRPTAVDGLLEVEPHIDYERYPTLTFALRREIAEHTASLLARRRYKHPLVPEAILWTMVAFCLAIATLPGAASATASFSRVVAYAAIGVLTLITLVVEILRLLEWRRLLR